jgi:hypothetical protein
MNYFIEAFSFIPKDICNHQTRTCITKWQCHSFNEERQYIDYFKCFIYPYKISKSLLLAAVMQNPYYIDADGKQHKAFDYDLIQLARKWLCDIVSGKSFYKNNKEYFTRYEAHYFLNSKIKYIDTRSVLNMFFEAKCKVRGMPDSLCSIITNVFSVKFEQCFNNEIVTSFLDLINRHTDCNIKKEELSDVCDFILFEINKCKESSGKMVPFSCSGRTMSSVIYLANEWHAQVQRETVAMAELQVRNGNAVMWAERNLKSYSDKKKAELFWKGLLIGNFRHENDDYLWTITQLCNINKLINEGRSMRHCVASYAGECSQGKTAIFHLSGYDKRNKSNVFSSATIEVRATDRTIYQIKGKCNAPVDSTTVNIIKRWAQNNFIKIK